MKNSDMQRKVLNKTLTQWEALSVTLCGTLNLFKITSNFKFNRSSVHKPHNHFNVKREPTLNIERSNFCFKYGGTSSKGNLAVCPAKVTTCTSRKYKRHFIRLSSFK